MSVSESMNGAIGGPSATKFNFDSHLPSPLYKKIYQNMLVCLHLVRSQVYTLLIPTTCIFYALCSYFIFSSLVLAYKLYK